MATDPTYEDDHYVERMKNILLNNERLRNLICAALMQLAADQILSEPVEENPDSI